MMEQHLSDRARRAAGRRHPRGRAVPRPRPLQARSTTRSGHSHGDELLIEVAERLHANVRPSDLVTRIGGDEFMIVLGQVVSVSQAARPGQPAALLPARAVHRQRHDVLRVGQHRPGVRLGRRPRRHRRGPGPRRRHRHVPGQGRRPRRGGGVRRVDARPAWPSASSSSATCASRSTCTSSTSSTSPSCACPTRSVVGMEALVRWSHPTHGVISPVKFIPLAEESGLISEIGDWVLEEAVAPVRRLAPPDARDGRPLRLGQPVRRAAPRRPDRRSRRRRAERAPARRTVAVPRAHRVGGHGRPRRRGRHPRRAAPPGRAHRHRRLRLRVLVAGLPEALPHDHAEDRQVVRRQPGQRRQRRRHADRHHRGHGARAGHHDGGRGGRDARCRPRA